MKNISPQVTITEVKLLQDKEICSAFKCGILMESLAMVSSSSNGPCLVWAMFSYNYPIFNLKVSSIHLQTPQKEIFPN